VFVSHGIFYFSREKKESNAFDFTFYFVLGCLFTLDRSLEYSVTLKFGLARMRGEYDGSWALTSSKRYWVCLILIVRAGCSKELVA
jgi:hypothetical protein